MAVVGRITIMQTEEESCLRLKHFGWCLAKHVYGKADSHWVYRCWE